MVPPCFAGDSRRTASLGPKKTLGSVTGAPGKTYLLYANGKVAFGFTARECLWEDPDTASQRPQLSGIRGDLLAFPSSPIGIGMYVLCSYYSTSRVGCQLLLTQGAY
jgi:hypothetical protein